MDLWKQKNTVSPPQSIFRLSPTIDDLELEWLSKPHTSTFRPISISSNALTEVAMQRPPIQPIPLFQTFISSNGNCTSSVIQAEGLSARTHSSGSLHIRSPVTSNRINVKRHFVPSSPPCQDYLGLTQIFSDHKAAPDFELSTVKLLEQIYDQSPAAVNNLPTKSSFSPETLSANIDNITSKAKHVPEPNDINDLHLIQFFQTHNPSSSSSLVVGHISNSEPRTVPQMFCKKGSVTSSHEFDDLELSQIFQDDFSRPLFHRPIACEPIKHNNVVSSHSLKVTATPPDELSDFELSQIFTNHVSPSSVSVMISINNSNCQVNSLENTLADVKSTSSLKCDGIFPQHLSGSADSEFLRSWGPQKCNNRSTVSSVVEPTSVFRKPISSCDVDKYTKQQQQHIVSRSSVNSFKTHSEVSSDNKLLIQANTFTTPTNSLMQTCRTTQNNCQNLPSTPNSTLQSHTTAATFPPATKNPMQGSLVSTSAGRRTDATINSQFGLVPAADKWSINSSGDSDEDAFKSSFASPYVGRSFMKPGDYCENVGDTPLNVALQTPGGEHLTDVNLRSVSELPEQYRKIFPFPYFNIVQSQVLDDVLYSNAPIVVSAPTGSGKTVVFELAIIRLLIQVHIHQLSNLFKVVYMAPIKALCNERYEDWKNKFGLLGLRCIELTGDSPFDDYFELQDVHIIFTTPEKWDHMTRRWRDNKSLMRQTQLFLIDEVHLLSDNQRGATLEAVVSRMKTIHLTLNTESASTTSTAAAAAAAGIRFIAVSATIPNAEDIADWLSSPTTQAVYHKMDDSCRPVKLRKVVLGFHCSDNTSEFRFDLTLSYRLANVIHTYSELKPTLVFCATRKSTIQTACTLIKDAKFLIDSNKKLRIQKTANNLKDVKLRDLVLCGVGYHHAGMDVDDRRHIEGMFAHGDLAVLISTSTLAMGVNLPAHLVVIKSTQHYVLGLYQEYTETQILQMIGRAGRPQFDTSATVVIMTRSSTKNKYDALLNGTQLIESSLHEHLIEHLNAEIVLSTITDVSVSLDWLRSTFLYIRVNKNPRHYGIDSGLSKDQIEHKLQELCLKNLNELAGIKLVEMDEDCFLLKPTDTGRLMARFCVAFETMKNFSNIKGSETFQELLTVVCRSHEFSDIQLRSNEKRVLNTLNKDKARLTIRFPMTGKIKSTEMKVNCLIQSHFGCLPLQDFALLQDVNNIMRAGTRVSHCLVEVLWQRDQFTALLSAVVLSKCFHSRIWENSHYIAKQLSGIGITLATVLVNAGLTAFDKIASTNPRDLELLLNRQPPFGNQICEAACHLPRYNVNIRQMSGHTVNNAELEVSITITNMDLVAGKSTASEGHTCVLLIGDTDNRLVYKVKLSDSQLLRSSVWSRKVKVNRAQTGDQLHIHFISQDWVGLDVEKSFLPMYVGQFNNTTGSVHQATIDSVRQVTTDSVRNVYGNTGDNNVCGNTGVKSVTNNKRSMSATSLKQNNAGKKPCNRLLTSQQCNEPLTSRYYNQQTTDQTNGPLTDGSMSRWNVQSAAVKVGPRCTNVTKAPCTAAAAAAAVTHNKPSLSSLQQFTYQRSKQLCAPATASPPATHSTVHIQSHSMSSTASHPVTPPVRTQPHSVPSLPTPTVNSSPDDIKWSNIELFHKRQQFSDEHLQCDPFSDVGDEMLMDNDCYIAEDFQHTSQRQQQRTQCDFPQAVYDTDQSTINSIDMTDSSHIGSAKLSHPVAGAVHTMTPAVQMARAFARSRLQDYVEVPGLKRLSAISSATVKQDVDNGVLLSAETSRRYNGPTKKLLIPPAGSNSYNNASIRQSRFVDCAENFDLDTDLSFEESDMNDVTPCHVMWTDYMASHDTTASCYDTNKPTPASLSRTVNAVDLFFTRQSQSAVTHQTQDNFQDLSNIFSGIF